MPEKNFAEFAKYEIMTITAWAYRRVSPAHFRLCADFMHLFWIFDDRTDEQTSAEVEHEIANVKRVLDDPTLTSPEQGVLEGVAQPSVSLINSRAILSNHSKVLDEYGERIRPSSGHEETILAKLHLFSRISC